HSTNVVSSRSSRKKRRRKKMATATGSELRDTNGSLTTDDLRLPTFDYVFLSFSRGPARLRPGRPVGRPHPVQPANSTRAADAHLQPQCRAQAGRLGPALGRLDRVGR